MNGKRRWLDVYSARRGSAAIEFAIIGPLMIIMAAATIELSMAMQCQYAVTKLASQYAVAWADCSDLPSGACLTERSLYTNPNSVQNVYPQLNPANLQLQMFQVSVNNGVTTTTYPANASLTPAQTAAVIKVVANGQNGVIVTANYTYNLRFFGGFFASTPFNGITKASYQMSYTIAQLKA